LLILTSGRFGLSSFTKAGGDAAGTLYQPASPSTIRLLVALYCTGDEAAGGTEGLTIDPKIRKIL
jgi:hypothetical protein